MRPRPAWPLALLLAGCAAAGGGDPGGAGAPEEGIPDVLAGLPPAVTAEKALFDLDSGDPERVRRARCVLLALPEGPGLDAVRARVRARPAGTESRLEALAILAERGDPLDAAAAGEVVSMCLHELSRPDPAGRSRMLSMDRLRAMGEAARPYLREASRPGSPRAEAAAGALRVLFDEAPDHRLREARP